MTAAEQLAAAIQRVIDETVERSTQGIGADTAMKLDEAGRIMGYAASYVLRLCKAGKLGSVGKGRNRRVLMSDIATYRRLQRNTRRTEPFPEARAASAH